MSESILVVDGHNAMHAWEECAELLRQSSGTSAARARLISELSLIHDASPWKVVVVFDRSKHGEAVQPAEKAANDGGVRVLFADGKRSADGVIESIVARYAADCRMMVASNDRMVLHAALGGGAEALSIAGLLEMIEHQRRNFSEGNRGHFRDCDGRS